MNKKLIILSTFLVLGLFLLSSCGKNEAVGARVSICKGGCYAFNQTSVFDEFSNSTILKIMKVNGQCGGSNCGCILPSGGNWTNITNNCYKVSDQNYQKVN